MGIKARSSKRNTKARSASNTKARSASNTKARSANKRLLKGALRQGIQEQRKGPVDQVY